MPINKKFLAPFVEGEFFHVYNRTNGSHKLFREKKNYDFFINGFEKYLADVIDLYSYCLLPSHFHFVVKIRHLIQIQEFLWKNKSNCSDINKLIVNQFKSFFISYTMAFNEFYDRQGSLFNHRFRRVAIHTENQLKDCIYYVHSNPVHHSLTKSFIDYPWSSYPVIISDEPTIVKRKEILELFGSREEFIKYHKEHNPGHCKAIKV